MLTTPSSTPSVPRGALERLAAALAALALCAASPEVAGAAKLDLEPNPALDPLVAPLERGGIDVLGSWESLGAELPPIRPRLASLAPVEPESAATAEAKWLFDYSAGAVAAVAVVPHELGEGESLDAQAFRAAWEAAPPERRLFVSFTRADAEAARRLRSVLEDAGFAGRLVWDDDAGAAGSLFRSAGQHAVLDSAETRRSGGIWLQAWMLDTIRAATGFRPARAEPEDPRVALSGGGHNGGAEASRPGGAPGADGERERSALPEPPSATVDDLLRGGAIFESLPGGILFGQTAAGEAGWSGSRLVIGPDERVLMISTDGRRRARLPAVGLADLRPCLEFALRTNPSQSVVHIDATRRVSLAPEFVDSAVGLRLIESDTGPFRHVPDTRAQKSLLFDRAVRFDVGADGDLRFHVVVDVWFVVPDPDGRARPVLTLQYATSERNPNRLEPGTMEGRTQLVGPDALEALGRAIAPAARYAAWIGFFRWAQASDVQLDELWSELGRRDFPAVRTPRVAPQA
jgi:hypothetical protein